MAAKEIVWSCPECGTRELALRYPSGKIKRCVDCQKYHHVATQATQGQPGAKAPFGRAQFLKWLRDGERRCAFCGLAEANVPKTSARSHLDLGLYALGIDRLDPLGDWSLDNLALCCFACQRVKGNLFTAREMAIIGPAIGQVWRKRLGLD